MKNIQLFFTLLSFALLLESCQRNEEVATNEGFYSIIKPKTELDTRDRYDRQNILYRRFDEIQSGILPLADGGAFVWSARSIVILDRYGKVIKELNKSGSRNINFIYAEELAKDKIRILTSGMLEYLYDGGTLRKVENNNLKELFEDDYQKYPSEPSTNFQIIYCQKTKKGEYLIGVMYSDGDFPLSTQYAYLSKEWDKFTQVTDATKNYSVIPSIENKNSLLDFDKAPPYRALPIFEHQDGSWFIVNIDSVYNVTKITSDLQKDSIIFPELRFLPYLIPLSNPDELLLVSVNKSQGQLSFTHHHISKSKTWENIGQKFMQPNKQYIYARKFNERIFIIYQTAGLGINIVEYEQTAKNLRIVKEVYTYNTQELADVAFAPDGDLFILTETSLAQQEYALGVLKLSKEEILR